MKVSHQYLKDIYDKHSNILNNKIDCYLADYQITVNQDYYDIPDYLYEELEWNENCFRY